jgi:Flp pilus assembly protein protease CpaA
MVKKAATWSFGPARLPSGDADVELARDAVEQPREAAAERGGGGDAKLLAATTLWLGFGVMLPYLIYASLLGGALTLLLLAARRWPLPQWLRNVKWIDRLHDSKSGVPYGIALAIAGILVYSDSVIFQRFLA